MQQNTIKGRPEIQDSGPHIIQVRLSGFQIIEKLNKLKKKTIDSFWKYIEIEDNVTLAFFKILLMSAVTFKQKFGWKRDSALSLKPF